MVSHIITYLKSWAIQNMTQQQALCRKINIAVYKFLKSLTSVKLKFWFMLIKYILIADNYK